ncbi:hypothetical protein ACSFBM_33085 [Variovorax sp. GB1R11]|uniref:hypothetical protein n=1 Tax=Variovorax sp. GB1R11 TaxID=3443741 RepID=UPI003F46473D
MRELSVLDMELVSGGMSYGDAVALGSAIGGGIGLSVAAQLGVSAEMGLALTGLAAGTGAALSAAGVVGWAIGNGLNEYTPIQSWITNIINTMNGEDSDGS